MGICLVLSDLTVHTENEACTRSRRPSSSTQRLSSRHSRQTILHGAPPTSPLWLKVAPCPSSHDSKLPTARTSPLVFLKSSSTSSAKTTALSASLRLKPAGASSASKKSILPTPSSEEN